MPTIPTEQEIYDEAKASMIGDPDTSLTDFSPGSVLDVMAGTIATIVRALMRWILRLVKTAFVSTSEGDDLDFVIADRVDLQRKAGESDEDFQARYYDYLFALARGTRRAWEYFLENVVTGADPLDYSLSEDLTAGTVEITVSPVSGDFTQAEILATAQAEKDEWRILGGPWPNISTEA